MSAEIVNLNQYRKQRGKAGDTKTAAENRRKHGRTKAERKAEEKDRARTDKTVEDAKLSSDDVDDTEQPG